MPKRRKLVVKKAFERLLDHCGGCVTVGDIRAVSSVLFVISRLNQ